MMDSLVLCLDVGGSHISCAVVHKVDKKLYKDGYARVDLDSMADRNIVLSQWDKAISSVLKKIEEAISEIYVSIPGPFDYIHGISLMDGMHKYQSLLNMDLKAYFSDKYKVSSDRIYFYNDAQAFLLGEVFGLNKFDKAVVGLTLGTGLGSAFYVNGFVKDLNYGSSPFRNGISEDYISTRGMLAQVKKSDQDSFEEIKDLVIHPQWEVQKNEAFNFLCIALQQFIAQYIIPLNPDVIILGGSIAKSHNLFFENLQSSCTIPIQIASMDEVNMFLGMIEYTTRNSESI
ncbi:ROK family protein [Sphingobacterium bovistauri]|uniref:ROK family protein n=1 Tax=Sphingobacterium bovistauri TaxID=2781959 RepID=A0ABS7ZC63_9SPHI|nr:ROK family protein [Sphingobacterium bovistauri]MCA5006314.1 ROK family protein [Sphingobacterium bovistauri]